MYVKPNDIREYVKAIVDLMDDEAVRTQLGKIGRGRIEDEFAWSYQERAYLRVYQRMTGWAASGTIAAEMGR